MPDGGQQKVVSVPGVGTIAFPGAMDDATINSQIQDYMLKTGQGMMEQGVAQGQRQQTQNLPPSIGSVDKSETPGVMGGLYRNTVGMYQGMKQAATAPATPQERQAFSSAGGMAADSGQATTDPTKIALFLHRLINEPSQATSQEGSGYFSQASKEYAGGHPWNAIGDIGSGAADKTLAMVPMAGPWINSVANRAQSGDIAGALTDIAMAKTTEHLPGMAKGAGQELLDEGFTKRMAMADRAAHAERIQGHVTNLANQVHEEAQQAMGTVSQKVDAKNPNGVFAKDDIRSAVKQAVGETVKIDEKMPPAIAAILKEGKTKPTESPIVGGKALDLKNPTDLKAYQNMKAGGAFTPEEIETFEGKSETPQWTFEQVKQMRSDLGRQLGAYDKRGAVGAAANDVYGLLSDKLRGAAKDAGAEGEWLDANGKYKNYVNDFQKSPLNRIVNAKTPTDVLGALSSKSELIDKIMQKYSGLQFKSRGDEG